MTQTDETLRTPIGPRLGLVHLLRLRSDPLGHSRWLRESYGDVYKIRAFGVDLYAVAGPDAFEQVFVNRDKAFENGPAWSYFIGPFFNRGLMLLDFDEHLHHRRIMQQAFGADSLRRYQQLMAPHVRRYLAEWDDVREPKLQRMFRDLTLELALEVFVGVELDADSRAVINKAFIDSVRAGTSVIRRDLPFGLGPWSKGLAGRRVLEQFFRDVLPDKRRDGGDDLFAQLCAARDDDGHEFTDDDVVNHMIFLLMAAHDTTTTTMTSMAYQLAKHPHWQERVRAEAQALTDPTYDSLQQLTDLDLVMKEALRLCAPVPSIPRMANRDVVIHGYRIPKGAFVSNSPYANQLDDAVWPNAERFDPERFAPERREDKVHRLAFQAFGAGVHKCIGMYFAGMQVQTVFHELLTHYRWSVPDDYVMPINMESLPYAPDQLPVTLERL